MSWSDREVHKIHPDWAIGKSGEWGMWEKDKCWIYHLCEHNPIDNIKELVHVFPGEQMRCEACETALPDKILTLLELLGYTPFLIPWDVQGGREWKKRRKEKGILNLP